VARIFISSTAEDLAEHRAAVVNTLRQLQHEPLVFEDLAADGYRSPVDQSRHLIDSCDVFVGLIAWRHGFVPVRDNPDGRSFVELEHRYAWDNGKPTLIFMTADDARWPQRFVDKGRQAELQERFRKEVLDRVTVSFFMSVEDLTAKVATAVTQWESDAASQPESTKPLAASVPLGVDPFELAWRLVVDFKADPALLRHMDLDHLKEAVDKWVHESRALETPPSRWYQTAQEQLRQKQTDLAPHPLWLAWMRATRASLQPVPEPKSHG
jgi:hypothetical protein